MDSHFRQPDRNSSENRGSLHPNRLPESFRNEHNARHHAETEQVTLIDQLIAEPPVETGISDYLRTYYKKCLREDPEGSPMLKDFVEQVEDQTSKLITTVPEDYGSIHPAVYSPALYQGEWPTEQQRGFVATVALYDSRERARYVMTENSVYEIDGEGRTLVERIHSINSSGQKKDFWRITPYLTEITYEREIRQLKSLVENFTHWYEGMNVPLLLGRALEDIQYCVNRGAPEGEEPCILPDLIEEMRWSKGTEGTFLISLQGYSFIVRPYLGTCNEVEVELQTSEQSE